MFDPEQELEYEQKCEQIAMQIQTLILDGIIAALGQLKHYFHEEDTPVQNPSKDLGPF